MARIETPFTFNSTAMDILEGIDLTGKTMIVTGGNGGVGKETVRALATSGASVVITARDPEVVKPLIEELRSSGAVKVEARAIDLSDLGSIRRFVADWSEPIDALVNNAGVMAIPELRRTREGRELQFATNFLGHFALTRGLEPWLRERGGRVVSVASNGSLYGPVLWDDPDFRFTQYDPVLAYAQSKTACVLLAVAIASRWEAIGITANALHPGAIPTDLQRFTGGLRTPEVYRKTVEQGAATAVLLAGSPLLDGVSGRYFEDSNEAEIVAERPAGRVAGVAAYALDSANADRVWSMANTMIGEAA